MGPHQITDRGSMALVRDPVGAVHGMWQPEIFHGFGVAHEPNSPGWFDHVSADPSWAAEYYAKLTGHVVSEPQPGLQILMDAQRWIASFSQASVVEDEPGWNAIYVVDDLARVRETVIRNGGEIVIESMPAPGSSICVFREPVCGNLMTVMVANTPED